MVARRAVFLDRDGTINENRSDHVKSLDEFVLIPGALDALRDLARLPLAVIVISNQSVINRGLASDEAVQAINRRLSALAAQAGGRIDGVYICPHRPDEDCRCRKPRPGLLEQAQAEHGLALAGSYLVGDAATDVELAKATGCRPVLVLSGRGHAQWRAMTTAQRSGVQVFADLGAAAAWIIDREAGQGSDS